MNYLKNRNLIIVAIVLVLLVGGYYLTNTKKTTTSSKDTGVNTNVDLNNTENSSKTSSTSSSTKAETKVSDSNISSVSPAAGSTVSSKPTEVSIKFSKVLRSGSEIKVVSAKGIDVVPSANTLSADGKTLSVPVTITAAGVYNVSYSYCLADNTCKTGSFSFTVK